MRPRAAGKLERSRRPRRAAVGRTGAPPLLAAASPPVCASSSISTIAGTTGSPGKCPWKYQSSGRATRRPRADSPGTRSAISSTSRIGGRCGSRSTPNALEVIERSRPFYSRAHERHRRAISTGLPRPGEQRRRADAVDRHDDDLRRPRGRVRGHRAGADRPRRGPRARPSSRSSATVRSSFRWSWRAWRPAPRWCRSARPPRPRPPRSSSRRAPPRSITDRALPLRAVARAVARSGRAAPPAGRSPATRRSYGASVVLKLTSGSTAPSQGRRRGRSASRQRRPPHHRGDGHRAGRRQLHLHPAVALVRDRQRRHAAALAGHGASRSGSRSTRSQFVRDVADSGATVFPGVPFMFERHQVARADRSAALRRCGC